MKRDIVKKILYCCGCFLVCFSILFSVCFLPVHAEDRTLYYYDDIVGTVSYSDGTIKYPFFDVSKFDFCCICPKSSSTLTVYYYLITDVFDSSSAASSAASSLPSFGFSFGTFKSDSIYSLSSFQSSSSTSTYSFIDSSGNTKYRGFRYYHLDYSVGVYLFTNQYYFDGSYAFDTPLRFYLHEFSDNIPSGELLIAKSPTFIIPKSGYSLSVVGSSDSLLSVRYHASGFSPSSGGNYFPSESASPSPSGGGGSSGSGSGNSSSVSGGSASVSLSPDTIHFEAGSVTSSIAADAVHFESGAVSGGSAVIEKDAVNVTVNNNNSVVNDPDFQNTLNSTIDNINKGSDGSGLHFNDILPHALEMVALVKVMPDLVSVVFGFLPSWCLNLVSVSFAVILTCVVASVIKGVFR